MPSSRPASPSHPDLGTRPWQAALFVVVSLGCQNAAAETGAPSREVSPPQAGSTADNNDSRRAPLLLLVRTQGDTGVMERLRAELERTAYSLVEIRLDDREGQQALEQIAQRQGAAAAVRLDASLGRIDLWVSRPGGGGVTDRISTQGARLSDWVLALRTTEALRAHGLDLGPAPGRASPPAQPPPRAHPTSKPTSEAAPGAESRPPAEAESAEAATAPARRASVGAGVGMGYDLSPGGVPPQVQGLAGIHFEANGVGTLRAFAWYPISRSRLSGPEGSARVKTWLLGSSVEAILLEQSNTSLTLGGGYALVVHTMKGTAAGGYRSAEDRVTSGAPFGRADLRLRLVSALRVDLAALVGASLPELRVKFDDRTVARWGRPFVAVGLTFESAFVYF